MTFIRQKIDRIERELNKKKGSKLYVGYYKADGTLFINGKAYKSEQELRKKNNIIEEDRLMIFDYVFNIRISF